MKIELKKTEELNGDTWYRVYIDNSCDRSFKMDSTNPDQALADSTEYYNIILLRQKQGFPKTETLLSSSN